MHGLINLSEVLLLDIRAWEYEQKLCSERAVLILKTNKELAAAGFEPATKGL